ncbi:MAG TPA: hypothetical protein V6C96_00390, partial [Vampirovibrionales bacterium]
GKVTTQGVLDPQTGFREAAIAPTKKLLDSQTGQIASIATLGLPVIVTLIGGSAKAVISKGQNIGLNEGESISINLLDNNFILEDPQ